MKLEFSQQIFEKSQKSYFVEFHTVGVKLFHANLKTDMKKVTVAFHNYSNAPKTPDKKEHITTKQMTTPTVENLQSSL
jgi:hypothetical protein